jgi:hypothetical protein
MDYLYGITKSRDIYSHELNEVLLKTPPKILSIAIWTYVTTILAVVGLGVLVDVNVNKSYEFVIDNVDGQTVLVSMVDFIDTSSINLKSALILKPKEARIELSKIEIGTLSLYKDKIIDEDSINISKLPYLEDFESKTKVTMFIASQNANALNGIKHGSIRLNFGSKKLYKLIMNN